MSMCKLSKLSLRRNQKTFSTFFLFVSLLISYSHTPVFASVNCSTILGSYSSKPDGGITFNNGRSSAKVYDLETILKNLNFRERDLPDLGPRVVLLGEGYSPLFKSLNEIPNIHVCAIDPIYGLNPIPKCEAGDSLRNFLNRYGSSGRLIAASSSQLPLPDGWATSVLSHMLINNFVIFGSWRRAWLPTWSSLAYDTLREAYRVTAPGGQIVFSAFVNPSLFLKLVETLSWSNEDLSIIYDGKFFRYVEFKNFNAGHRGPYEKGIVLKLSLRKPL